jgi:hypothetical protein
MTPFVRIINNNKQYCLFLLIVFASAAMARQAPVLSQIVTAEYQVNGTSTDPTPVRITLPALQSNAALGGDLASASTWTLIFSSTAVFGASAEKSSFPVAAQFGFQVDGCLLPSGSAGNETVVEIYLIRVSSASVKVKLEAYGNAPIVAGSSLDLADRTGTVSTVSAFDIAPGGLMSTLDPKTPAPKSGLWTRFTFPLPKLPAISGPFSWTAVFDIAAPVINRIGEAKPEGTGTSRCTIWRPNEKSVIIDSAGATTYSNVCSYLQALRGSNLTSDCDGVVVGPEHFDGKSVLIAEYANNPTCDNVPACFKGNIPVPASLRVSRRNTFENTWNFVPKSAFDGWRAVAIVAIATSILLVVAMAWKWKMMTSSSALDKVQKQPLI